MKLSSLIKGKFLVVSIEGDLIGESSGAEIVGYVNDNVSEIINSCAVDLNKVRYMNSSGIGVLITLHTKISGKGGVLALVNPSDQIQKLLEITKLDEVFKIVTSVEQALELL